MYGNPEVTTGGRALKFYSSVRIDVRRIEALKNGSEIIGNRTRAKVVKNKMAPPFREAEFDIMYGEGISLIGELIDLGVKLGLVQKSGSWYSMGETRIGQGRDSAKQYLRDNPEVAEKLDLPVAMHVAGSYEEYSYIMRGSTPLSVRGIETGGDALTDRPMWLPTGVTPVNYALNWNAFNSHDVLAAHCVHVDDNDIAKLKEHDVAISVNTRCNAQLGMGLAPLPTFLKSGIRVGLGTDSPAATDSSDMFIEMRLGMLIHRSVDRDVFLTAKTMLELATIGGARALHMEDEIGTLEPGKRADITVVDLSGSRQTPLVDPVTAVVEGGAAADVMFTMVGGKPVYERGSKWDVRGNKWEMLINPAEARERGMQIRGKLRD